MGPDYNKGKKNKNEKTRSQLNEGKQKKKPL